MEPSLYDRDEDLLEACRADGQPRLRVYACADVEVVLGRGSRLEVELDVEMVRADAVTVTRRRGGGCAVVLDPGNVVVAWAERLLGLGGSKAAFARLSARLIQALARLGVSGVAQRGISDLALGDRKIGGACIYRTKDLLFYSTTLLVTPDLELVERYLRHPPREPDYRRGRRHADFLGSLAEPLGGADSTQLVAALHRELVGERGE